MRKLTHLTVAAALLLCHCIAQAQQTALLGAWQCQTPDGPASLSFGNTAGSGYGSGGGSGGTYAVTAVQVGTPIRVRWANGEDDQATVHHVINGRITEIRYGKQVLGHAMCNM